MTTRVFGPVRGAGVQMNEEIGQETLEQGFLGSTLLIGPFERGAEGDITILPSSRSLLRKMGDLIDPAEYDTPVFSDLRCPLTAKHFWDRSRGSGRMVALRVVPTTNNASRDDRPDKSKLLIWNRESSPKLIGEINAHNGGSWAGKRKHFLGAISGVPGVDFPASNQIQLDGITTKDFKYDEYRNGDVVLDGLPGYSYKIVNIDPDGLITLETDQDVATDWGAGETAGSVTGNIAGPWNLAPGDTVIVHCDEDLGGPDTATITATQATIAGVVPAIAAMNGKTVIFTVDGGDEQTVTFTAAAVDLATTLAELNTQSLKCHWQDDGGGNIDVYSDTYGSDSEIDITGGTGLVEIGHAIATSAATGDPVANIDSVTWSELKTIIEAAVTHPATGVTVTATAGGFLKITSDTTGALSSIQIEVASTGDTALGLDNVKHDGSAGPADLDVNLVRTNTNLRGLTKACTVEFRDGALRADEEFGMIVRVDGRVVLNYADLSMLTGSTNYWASVINNDPNNDIITVTDSFTGDRSQATARPANHYGIVKVLTATRLTIADPEVYGLTVAGTWVPSITWTWGSECKTQRLKVTVLGGAATFSVETDHGTRVWTGNIAGAAVDMEDYVGTLAVGTTSGAPLAGDYFYLYLKPFEPDELIGGRVFPNITDASQRNQNFSIIDNGVSYVDVSGLDDLTDAGSNTAGKDFRIQWPQQMAEGYDGYLAGMTTSAYEALLDAATSPARKVLGRGYGLVKMAAPGTAYYTTGVALSQKLKTLAASYGWHAKVEFPWLYHDWDVYYEEDLIDWINNTFLRGDNGDYTSTHFPCFAYIRDPFASAEGDARNVLVPALGLILGNEAYIANKYEGYHKAPAGITVSIPEIVELPVVGRPDNPIQLDEEKLNPAGINILKWASAGSTVIQWGDRTLSRNSVLKWLHKRYMLSQYENDLREGFDFTIFEINDPIEDARVLAALHDYFLPEFRKRAIRGNTFVGGQNPAAIFKMDTENNTDATRAQGDQIVEISLRLADTIERLRIYMSAMGVVEPGI